MWNKLKNWVNQFDSNTNSPQPEKKVWDDEPLYHFLKKYPHTNSMKNFRVAELLDEIRMNRARIIELELKFKEVQNETILRRD